MNRNHIGDLGAANGHHESDSCCHKVKELKALLCVLHVVWVWRHQGRKCIV
jgi:hypothetical protein